MIANTEQGGRAGQGWGGTRYHHSILISLSLSLFYPVFKYPYNELNCLLFVIFSTEYRVPCIEEYSRRLIFDFAIVVFIAGQNWVSFFNCQHPGPTRPLVGPH